MWLSTAVGSLSGRRRLDESAAVVTSASARIRSTDVSRRTMRAALARMRVLARRLVAPVLGDVPRDLADGG